MRRICVTARVSVCFVARFHLCFFLVCSVAFFSFLLTRGSILLQRQKLGALIIDATPTLFHDFGDRPADAALHQVINLSAWVSRFFLFSNDPLSISNGMNAFEVDIYLPIVHVSRGVKSMCVIYVKLEIAPCAHFSCRLSMRTVTKL